MLRPLNDRIYPIDYQFRDRDMDNFFIPGNPADYYETSQNENGVVEYRAVRGKVRSLVDIYGKCLNDVIASGGNPHAVSLDISDEVRDFLASEPEGAKLVFYEVYTQEINSAISTSNEKTSKLNSTIAKNKESTSMAAQVIVALVVFLIAMVFIFN